MGAPLASAARAAPQQLRRAGRVSTERSAERQKRTPFQTTSTIMSNLSVASLRRRPMYVHPTMLRLYYQTASCVSLQRAPSWVADTGRQLRRSQAAQRR